MIHSARFYLLLPIVPYRRVVSYSLSLKDTRTIKGYQDESLRNQFYVPAGTRICLVQKTDVKEAHCSPLGTKQKQQQLEPDLEAENPRENYYTAQRSSNNSKQHERGGFQLGKLRPRFFLAHQHQYHGMNDGRTEHA